MEKEFRTFSSGIKINDDNGNGESRIISGYAVRFNEQSRYISMYDRKEMKYINFYEIISRDAITNEVLDNSDIFLNYNHDDGNFLARRRNGVGSLHLELREDGLYFEFDCPDTAFGNDILTKIKRGELDECSFCFSLPLNDKSADSWEVRDNIKYRTINKIERIYDCCICPVGAYGTTTVSARCKRAIDEMDEISEKIAKKRQELHDLVKNINKSEA